MVVGLVIRWKAIVTLGEQFTGKVKIFSTQRLIQNGPYKHVRHPGYTGGLLAHLGMAIAFSNWISILLIFFPVVVAAIYRMHVEEEALLRAFGNEYAEYSSRTKRLVPMIY